MTETNLLQVGTRLNDKYTIKRHIASGGFGNTYEAVNEFGERVAIKEFFLKGINQRDGDSTSVSVSNDENRTQFTQQRAKFKQEAMHLRGLLSAHVVKVQSYFEENGTSYYVMNYIDGESLSRRLERTGQPVTETEARRILDHILEALGEAHQKGIYHLDLKPGNIMLDNQGNTLLIDFGASKQADNSGSLSTLPPAYTKEYAPLEQLEGNVSNIGPWTDFYALGATLYRILTGQTPPSYTSILTEGASAFRFTAAVPTDMCDLITWMMQPNRRKRPQSVSEIRQRMNNPHKRGSQQPEIPEIPIGGDTSSTRGGEDTLVGGNGKTHVENEPQSMFRNPFSFKGRIRRLEYNLSFIIFHVFLCLIIAIWLYNVEDWTYKILCLIFSLLFVNIWFGIAQSVKRSHDLGESGSNVSVLQLMFQDGYPGENEYGPDPKGRI